MPEEAKLSDRFYLFAQPSAARDGAKKCATPEQCVADNCYASANIKALETLGYAEHICNYVVILDSWFYGKKHVV